MVGSSFLVLKGVQSHRESEEKPNLSFHAHHSEGIDQVPEAGVGHIGQPLHEAQACVNRLECTQKFITPLLHIGRVE